MKDNRKKVKVEVVPLEGSSFEIGVQQGLVRTKAINCLRWSNLQQDTNVEEAIKLFKTFSPSLLQELNGLAEGMGLKADKVIQLFGGYNTTMPPLGCSSFANDSFYVRNYDFSDELYDARFVCMKPEEGYASVGFSEHIIGRLDGMNEKGLVIGLHFVNHHKYQDGFLATSICRVVLDQCATVEEAIAIIKKIPHRFCFNFSMMDRNGKSVIVEASPLEQHIHYSSPLICTNHFESASLTNWNRRMMEGSQKRKAYLQTLDSNKLSPISAYQIFNNEDSPLFFKYYKEFFGTLHTIVYQPENLSLMAGVGGDCDPYSLSLHKWLKGDSDFPPVMEGSIEEKRTS